ncbi:methyltransferase domain-containing protein [Amycolatopsis sp. NPDC005232]|uniref:class I SAM-dependent methyltransferase n=1 Tax=Amycolatopsis sp. NPDC005232 TaxID=3157027 RepID=UPI0033BA4672
MTKHDPRFSAAFWDQCYSGTGQVWIGEPNPALVKEVSSLPPGTVLDAGCGEGADTIGPAGQGWQVTAVDFSTQALHRAAEHTSRPPGRTRDLAARRHPRLAARRTPPPRSGHRVLQPLLPTGTGFGLRSPHCPSRPPTDIW